MKTKLLLIVGVLLVLVLCCGSIFGFQAWVRSTEEVVTIKVTDTVVKANGSSGSTYLVFTDKGVYANEDVMMYGKFDSSDFQSKLKKGNTYTVKVAGWRIPFFSMYKNIVEIENE